MDDLQNVFSEFKTQVLEIADHAQSVQKLTFKAELKNGTAFNFKYDADTFGPKQAYHPLSIFNGILDIASAFVAVWLLASFIVRMMKSDTVNLSLLLALSLMAAVFVFSSLHHFMHRDKRSSLVFANLKEISKILALAFINLSITAFFDSSKLQLTQSLSLVFVALCLLFLLGRTQLSLQVSLALAAILPLLSLVSSLSFESVTRALLFSLWSIVALVSKQDSRMHTTSLFALVGLLSFASQLNAVMI
ncbi:MULTISPECIES: hypothetical protein [Sphaerochaeta]|jgi:hypothetical protein|uniref:hypothetical protein n=1 Tax=Sphaerochaeta TaxID=399320 RepID=UPI0025828947|nr:MULTISPECIES: hypothetical protein [Sphaerochaeta]MDD3424193.1 hypothetical protein [Sphaerochaeta sp.]MEA5107025.1 hypothetical protein [Sphaerochaeta associata]